MNAQTSSAASLRWNLGGLSGAAKLALSLVVVFILLTIFFQSQTDGIFFSPRNLSLLLRQASVVAVLAAGGCVLMIMKEIDLSIGSAVFLCGVTAATLNVHYGASPLVCVAAAVGLGVVLGLWQRFWVVFLSIPSFIVTLAGLLAFRGIGYLATDAATIAPVSQPFVSLSESFIPPVVSYVVLAVIFLAVALLLLLGALAQPAAVPGTSRPWLGTLAYILVAAIGLSFFAWVVGGFRGIPMTLIWAVVIGVVFWLLTSRTVFGRNAYLIGANREAAEFAGINIHKHVLGGFILMGVLYGIGGVLLTARLASSTPGAGVNLELDAIAAAVIGGTALSGGVGTVPGAMVGALLLATIDNGMSLMNVSSSAQLVAKGAVLLSALGINAYIMKRR